MNKKEYYLQKLYFSFLKVSAFTLWDMLTAMIISGTIVSAIYMFLMKIQTATTVDEKILNQLEELISFEKQLYYDFTNSDKIYMDHDIIYFDFEGDFTFLELKDTLCSYFRSENVFPVVFPIESFKTFFIPQDYNLIAGLEIVVSYDNNHSYPLIFTKFYDKKKLYKLEKSDDRYK